MKKYERVLRWVGKALKIIIIILTLGAGWIGGNKLWDSYQITNAENIEARRVARAEREASVNWCLDNGGRTIEVDGIEGCFELTPDEVSTGLFEDPACKNPTSNNIFLHRLGDDHIDACFTFKRIVQEN